MKLIVGLGNPGAKYQKTRHNLGFVVVEHLTKELFSAVGEEDRKIDALIYRQGEVILLEPLTFMNASGVPVAKIASFYHIFPAQIMVIHDDVDLSLGKIKLKQGSASAGHHGVESINKELGSEDYWRMRLGIEHPGHGVDGLVERYVLQEFLPNEQGEVSQMVEQAVNLAKDWLKIKYD